MILSYILETVVRKPNFLDIDDRHLGSRWTFFKWNCDY